MSDVIVLNKSMLRQVGLLLLAASLALGTVYWVKRKLLKSGPFEVASIEQADASHIADRDTVTLKDGTKISSIGFALKSVGSLSKDPDHGVLILRGMECQDCAATESLLLHTLPEGRTIRMPFPGQLFDPPSGDKAKGDPSFESRVFYGECLDELGPSLVTYKNERSVDGSFKQSMNVMSFNSDGVFVESSREEAPFQIGELLKSAEKHCREIEGIKG